MQLTIRFGSRSAILLAAALTSLSASVARADEWCGYATHSDAVVECGYTTVADCETAVGKGGMCFVDPDLAQNSKRFSPVINSKIPAHS